MLTTEDSMHHNRAARTAYTRFNVAVWYLHTNRNTPWACSLIDDAVLRVRESELLHVDAV